MHDVLCMGSATLDLFVKIDRKITQCKPGEKILVDELDFETGGGGTNTAVALAKMGVKTAYLGKIGGDPPAQRIVEELKKYKVRRIPVKNSEKNTAFSVVLDSTKEHDRLIYVHKGAANDLHPHDFKMKRINTKWVYLATMMGPSLDTAIMTVHALKNKGAKVLFNPAEYLVRRPRKISHLLKHTDILVLNKLEAQILAGKKLGIAKLGPLLRAKGPETVVITQGNKAVHYFDAVQHLCVMPPKSKPVSTAGAGDAFTSGFLAGLIRGENVATSLQIGIVNSSATIMKRGAKEGQLTFDEAKKKIKGLKLSCVSR